MVEAAGTAAVVPVDQVDLVVSGLVVPDWGCIAVVDLAVSAAAVVVVAVGIALATAIPDDCRFDGVAVDQLILVDPPAVAIGVYSSYKAAIDR